MLMIPTFQNPWELVLAKTKIVSTPNSDHTGEVIMGFQIPFANQEPQYNPTQLDQ